MGVHAAEERLRRRLSLGRLQRAELTQRADSSVSFSTSHGYLAGSELGATPSSALTSAPALSRPGTNPVSSEPSPTGGQGHSDAESHHRRQAHCIQPSPQGHSASASLFSASASAGGCRRGGVATAAEAEDIGGRERIRCRAEPGKPDLGQGLRMLVLGENPSSKERRVRGNPTHSGATSIERSRPGTSEGLKHGNDRSSSPGRPRRVGSKSHGPATKDESIRVYRAFWKILATDISPNRDGPRRAERNCGGSPRCDSSATSDDGTEGSTSYRGALRGWPHELPPIAWSVFLEWIEAKGDANTDYRFKSTCTSLAIAVKVWMKQNPALSRSGVLLAMFYRWIWERASCREIAGMLSWVCQYELGKVQQPTPRLICAEERKQLVRLFAELDEKHQGYCFALDIAGGEHPNQAQKLKNLVDLDTATAVFGEGHIDLDRFLELMCTEECRGHEGVTRVALNDGQVLIRQSRELAHFDGWLWEDCPEHEKDQRILIGTIEAEVLRWRQLADQEEQRAREEQLRRAREALYSEDDYEPPD